MVRSVYDEPVVISKGTFLTGAFFALVIIGCGGGSGNGSVSPPPATKTRVKFTINWTERSRDLNAPSSARSLTVTLKSVSTSQTVLTQSFNRRDEPSAYSEPITTNDEVEADKEYQFTATFHADANGAGTIVGVGSASATINEDGNGVPIISTDGTVKSVQILASQLITLPNSADLLFEAKNADGQVLALSPGSGLWTLKEGTDVVTLTKDGKATGLKQGTAVATVSVDGIESNPMTISVADPNAIKPEETLTFRSGMNTYTNSNQESSELEPGNKPYSQFSKAIQKSQEYGASFLRTPAAWKDWNHEIGNTDWVADASMYFGYREKAVQQAGMSSSVVCVTDRFDNSILKLWPTDDVGIEAYARNVKAIVGAFKEATGILPSIEIGNEVTTRIPNIQTENDWNDPAKRQAYVKIVHKVKQELAAEYAGTKLWSSSASNGTEAAISPAEFITFCKDNNLDFDGYVVNLYKGHATGTQPEDNIKDLQDAVEVADGKPVRVGEFGYHTLSWTPEQQVNYALRSFLSILIGSGNSLVRASLYEIRDRGDGGQGWCNGSRFPDSCAPIETYATAPEARFGLLNQDLSPKSNSARWKEFFQTFGGYRFSSGGSVSPGSTDYQVVLVGPNNTQRIIRWKSGPANDPTTFPTW